jgi:signal transduction histidine kinase
MVRTRWLSGLRVRLVLLVLLPLIPVFVVAIVNARQNRSDAVRDVRRNAQALSRLAAAQIDQRLEAGRQLLATLAVEQGPTARGPAACRRHLAEHLRAVGTYVNLAVIDGRGNIVCTARPPGRPGASVAGTMWWQRLATTDGLVVGDDLGGLISRRPAVVIAAPSRGGTVLVAAQDLNAFGPVASSIELPVQATLTVFQTDGVILARFPDPRRYVGKTLSRAGIVRAGRQIQRGVGEATGLDGRRRIYGFSIVGTGPSRAIVSVGLSKQRALAAANRTVTRTLVTLLVVALLAIALALAVAYRLIDRPVRALTAANRRIAGGDLTVRSGLREEGEFGELAAAFDEMAATLESRQHEIDRSAGERQRLLAELVAAEEEERKRIAGDVHDDTIQALSALLLRLEIIELRMEKGAQRDALAEAREAAREAVVRLRHLVFKLSPPELEKAGLAPALETFLDEMSRVWGHETTLSSELRSEPSPEVRALVYRIVAEAVNNAAKHSHASTISVSVGGRDGGVWARVEDDGTGFDVDAERQAPGHLGLSSMRERAESAGGWWLLASQTGRGTSIEFWVPDSAAAGDPEAAAGTTGDTA